MKSLFIFSLLFSLLVLPSNALAESSPSSKPSIRREERKVEMEEKRQEIKNRISTAKKERIMSFSNQMTLRIEATISRLETLVERIKTRVDKIKDSSEASKITEINNSLDQAQKLIDKARLQLETLKSDLEKVLITDNLKDTFTEVRKSFNDTRDTLKEAHKILVSTIGDIKGLRVGESNE